MTGTVCYAGAVWDIAATEGPFVDLVRTDDEGSYEARVMASNLAPNVGGGYTWQENREPCTDPDSLETQQRQARAADEEAMALFAASSMAADRSWTTITEQQREKFRELARVTIAATTTQKTTRRRR